MASGAIASIWKRRGPAWRPIGCRRAGRRLLQCRRRHRDIALTEPHQSERLDTPSRSSVVALCCGHSWSHARPDRAPTQRKCVVHFLLHCDNCINGVRENNGPGRKHRWPQATLTISSKNYSSWSLRGWLLCKIAGLDFAERSEFRADDPAIRAELLLLSSSILVPCLKHGGITVWDTLAIGEYLNESETRSRPAAQPTAEARTRCRSICGEMHSGFANLRSSLPMNIKARYPGFKIWSRARGRYRPHRDHLERMPGGLWRAVPVRRALDGRRHVCAGCHPLPDL